MKSVIFCGGGSGGHVLPALTLMRFLKEKNPEISLYAVGSEKGIESTVFKGEGIPFKDISTGKLRRYFSLENFFDLFRILAGIFQSFSFLFKFNRKETVVFSTGGFVTVPVVFAAWLQGKKIIVHEQTSRVGLANKICSLFADQIIITFEASKGFFPPEKTIHLGYPLRKEILSPPSLTTLSEIDLGKNQKPILFLTGGGNGSLLLNNLLKEIRAEIENDFFIVHQCGKNFLEELKPNESESYKVLDFVNKDMVALLANADVVISRSGAGTVVELLSLGKPSIFIPLKIAQKNEQYWNAMEAHEKLGSLVIKEEEANKESLLMAIKKVREINLGTRVQLNPAEKIIEKIIRELKC